MYLRRKNNLLILFVTFFYFSCNQDDCKENVISNGCKIEVSKDEGNPTDVISDSISMVFEGGFKDNLITIFDNKKIIIERLVSSDSIFTKAASFCLKRSQNYTIGIDSVHFRICIPSKFEKIYIRKNKANVIKVLFSNNSHLYQ